MNQRVLCFILCSILLLGITGCGNTDKETEKLSNPLEETKINLNDNIEVTVKTESTGTPDCFFYMFATNLEEVFPNAKIYTYDNYRFVSYWMGNANDRADGEITEEDLKTNINALQFNSNQEKAIDDLFKQYQDSEHPGIKEVEYSFSEHRLSFAYHYLIFKNNDDKYLSDGEILNSEVQKILVDAIRFNGTCGGFDFSEDMILTEELCEEYHLSCDRW